MVKNSLLSSVGALHVWPLSVDRANPMELPKPKNVPGNGARAHATYASLEPKTNAGFEP
jgi:hypothetical protein